MKEEKKLPVIALRRRVLLPGRRETLFIERSRSVDASVAAMKDDGMVFFSLEKNDEGNDVYETGVMGRIKSKTPSIKGSYRIVIDTESRGKLTCLDNDGKYLCGTVEAIPASHCTMDSAAEDAHVETLKQMVSDYEEKAERLEESAERKIFWHKSLKALMDDVMTFVYYPNSENFKQKYLEADEIMEMYSVVADCLNYRIRVDEIKKEIDEKTLKNQENLKDEQIRKNILRAQMEVISRELNEDNESEILDMTRRIEKLNADSLVKEKLQKELNRYKRTAGMNIEGEVIRNYIETMLSLPWNNMSEDNLDLNHAAEILNRDHYGLEKVKDRILEFLAVRTLIDSGRNRELKTDGTIICLVGPPGTGKTSIARSMAEALNKRYVRISLGGVSDESEIRGHRRTYVGAMPGRIAQALIQAKTSNPLILIDEVDKIDDGRRGDPSSALLEVLDPEQNNSFRDNYIETPLDLSNVLFIATANYIDGIPAPLRDRMEVIELEGYTDNEKFHIGRDYLLDKTRRKNGISKSRLRLSDEGMKAIIRGYTREAGVRELERSISKICRKAARKIVQDDAKRISVTAKNLDQYLGVKKYSEDRANTTDEIGIVRGLAWTAAGGVTLQIEVNKMAGKGTLYLTGQMGDVMKESAQIALSYVRSIAENYGVEREFFEKYDIHLHIPEGAVPKDGPSAGITMAAAMLSAAADIPVKCTVAMTGEINLRGNVLPVGGLKEKLLAAKLAGIAKVLVPEKNRPDITEVSKEITDGLDIVYVSTMDDVLKDVLVDREITRQVVMNSLDREHPDNAVVSR